MPDIEGDYLNGAASRECGGSGFCHTDALPRSMFGPGAAAMSGLAEPASGSALRSPATLSHPPVALLKFRRRFGRLPCLRRSTPRPRPTSESPTSCGGCHFLPRPRYRTRRRPPGGPRCGFPSVPAPLPPGMRPPRVGRIPQPLVLNDPGSRLLFAAEAGGRLRKNARPAHLDAEAVVRLPNDPIGCLCHALNMVLRHRIARQDHRCATPSRKYPTPGAPAAAYSPAAPAN